jgi:hypothetical protein
MQLEMSGLVYAPSNDQDRSTLGLSLLRFSKASHTRIFEYCGGRFLARDGTTANWPNPSATASSAPSTNLHVLSMDMDCLLLSRILSLSAGDRIRGYLGI